MAVSEIISGSGHVLLRHPYSGTTPELGRWPGNVPNHYFVLNSTRPGDRRVLTGPETTKAYCVLIAPPHSLPRFLVTRPYLLHKPATSELAKVGVDRPELSIPRRPLLRTSSRNMEGLVSQTVVIPHTTRHTQD